MKSPEVVSSVPSSFVTGFLSHSNPSLVIAPTMINLLPTVYKNRVR
jgi:hypothetical protein